MGLWVFFILNTAYAVTPVSVKKETPNYLIDIQYPQGFQYSKIDSGLKEYIATMKKSFLTELADELDTPKDAPGKTGLTVKYSILYDTKTALSVRFDISIYHRGAAHPINTVAVHNYLNGEQQQLADLFVKGADYLKPIALFCNKAITAKKISDANWIKEGTKPTLDNYSVWYFTNKGIAIIFNTYQVAPYAYGAHAVDIPFSVISSLLKPELSKAVWGY